MKCRKKSQSRRERSSRDGSVDKGYLQIGTDPNTMEKTMRQVRSTHCHSLVAVLVMVFAVGPGPCFAQASKQPASPAAPAATPEDDETVKKLKEGSQEEFIETHDGVFLLVNYWRPKDAGRNTPVVILLHMRGKSQRDWFPLAKQLHDDGMAVVTFDFRGHAESRRTNPELYRDPSSHERIEKERRSRNAAGARVIAPGTRERAREADRSKVAIESIDHASEFRNGRDFCRFLARDVHAVKRFLVDQNNAGRLNIRRLGLVAAGEGCSVAMQWMDDFEFKDPVMTGRTRLGGDLSALVLVSPIWNYKGMRPPVSFGEGSDQLPILLISGDKDKTAADARQFARLMRIPEGPSTKLASGGRVRPNSVWIKENSTLEGTDLVRAGDFKVDAKIRGFLMGRLTSDVRLSWERRNPEDDPSGFGSSRD